MGFEGVRGVARCSGAERRTQAQIRQNTASICAVRTPSPLHSHTHLKPHPLPGYPLSPQLKDLSLGDLLDTPPPGVDEAIAISKARPLGRWEQCGRE